MYPTPLTALYDLAVSPITFDYTTYLAGAECARQIAKYPSIDLNIAKWQYRSTTDRDRTTSKAEKDWRVDNILIQASSLLHTISSFSVTTEKPDPGKYLYINIPGATTLAAYICALHRKGANPRVLQALPYISNSITRPGYITLSLRNSTMQPERNVELHDWYKFYEYLIDKGERVIVIPDQFDLLYPGDCLKYNWPKHEAAALNLQVRAAVYEKARINFSTNVGTTGLLFYTESPYIIFDQLRNGSISAKRWKDKYGLDIGEQYEWAKPTQFQTWTDSTYDNLVETYETKKHLFA